jgi:uncharacterized protein (DUF885 family)
MRIERIGISLALVAVTACGTATPATTSTTAVAPASSTTTAVGTTTTTTGAVTSLESLDGLGFDDFVEASYEILLLRSPQQLTALGVAADYGLRNDALDDLSPGFLAETQALESGILDRLREFDRSALTPDQQVSYDVYDWYLGQKVAGHRFAYHAYPLSFLVNSYNVDLVIFFTEQQPLTTVGDAEDYVSRLAQISRQVSQLLERLAISEDAGVTPVRDLIDWTIGTMRDDIGGATSAASASVDRIPLYTSFADRLGAIEGIDDATRASLLDRARTQVAESFVPAWLSIIDHLQSIKGQARTDAGVWSLPDGDEYYLWLLRDNTSTDLTPDEVHQLGLDAVARVQGELRDRFTAMGYPQDASLGSLRERARTEAGFLPGGVAIVSAYEALITGAESAMRPYFGLWPRGEVGVVADPGGGGFYVPGSVDGTRPGLFHANASGQVSKMTMPTITYHETVPGHHTPIQIAQELDLPTFRRYVVYNAFAEGWALYAERLAAEAGLYDDDPYGDVGRLEFELLRAVRLVVDTGIHWQHWTRQQAHDYMDETISGYGYEVERYLVMPAQATGYMIGMQTILDLRGDANGPEELAAFHDEVLGGGSMPLGVLERVVGGR